MTTTAGTTREQSRRWLLRDAGPPGRAESLARALGLSPTVAALLAARGVGGEEEARALLNPSLSQLHDPFLMLGMREAVERVLRAVDAGERVLVYGDYDVDGTTGTVVLRRALSALGARTGFHVPHRFTEGYGIRQDVLERARDEGYTLVISVDCGIRAFEPLEWARENGLDVIVTDHHLPDEGEGAPPAFAVLNPNQRGCPYPDKHLAGVGVAFKLAHALFRERGKEKLVPGFLKVVAIGTVADVARLVGENRAIVALGLADVHAATNHGLRALLEVAGCTADRPVRAFDLGFRLGPRINAAGRMDAARAVVELFEARDIEEARRLAARLDALNSERQRVQQEVTERALAELEFGPHADDPVAVAAGRGWHRGVIGLAASRLCERTGRPAVVITFDEDGAGHGSARSTEDFHMLDALTGAADLLDSFGGHAHAAGLLVREENLPALRERLNAHARGSACLAPPEPCLHADLELAPERISLELCDELCALEPFGQGWPEPVFVSRDLRIVGEPRVMKERHYKFNVNTEGGRVHEAVWWGGVEKSAATPRPGARIELAYALEANNWNGRRRLQLSVKDMKESSGT